MKGCEPSKRGEISLGNGRLLPIGKFGLIAIDRVVAVGWVKSAPMRRLIRATQPEWIVVLTGGQRRQTALVLDSGHVVITPMTIAELTCLLDMDDKVRKV